MVDAWEDEVATIMDGSEPLDVSHAGGEFEALTCEMKGDFWEW